MKKLLSLLLALCLVFGLPILAAAEEPSARETFVPVEDITAGFGDTSVGTPLEISGSVVPLDATNKVIQWSIADAGTTGATLSYRAGTGSLELFAVAEGRVILKAVVAGGLADGKDFEKLISVDVGPGLS